MTIFRNKIFIYLLTRYLTYGLQFFLSLIIAVRLGPYYLGVYGVVQLILSYFDQINFGIPHSLNVLLVHNKNDKERQEVFTMNSLFIYTIMNVFVMLTVLGLYLKGNTVWGEYDIEQILFFIVLIAVCQYYNTALTMVVRFRNQVNILSIIGTIPVVLNLAVVFFFKKESLVFALVASNFVSCILTLMIFYRVGAIPRFSINKLSKYYQKIIIKKGFYLFLYNSCFYFILIGIRTLISKNYPVEEFGYFTFSFTIANAVMLLLNSLNTIIFPKTIDLMSIGTLEEKKGTIQKLRVGYITSANLLIFFALICFPVIICLMPKFQPALTSMNLIALSVLMQVNSYGYITLLIAHNKEKLASIISLVALLLSLSLGSMLVYLVRVDFSYVIIAVMVSYMVFSYLAYYCGTKELHKNISLRETMYKFIPIRISFPYIIAFIICVLELEWLVWLPLLFFIVVNTKDVKMLVTYIFKLARNPHVIDV